MKFLNLLWVSDRTIIDRTLTTTLILLLIITFFLSCISGLIQSPIKSVKGGYAWLSLF